MACQVEVVAEAQGWLNDLRVRDPAAARLVDEAIDALAAKGAALGPPLVVQVGMERDVERAADDWYQRQLERLQDVRRDLADVAMSRERADLQVGEAESSVTALDRQIRQALARGAGERAAELRTEMARKQEHLAAMREQRSDLARREQELAVMARRAHTDSDLFRIRKESMKAKYAAAQAKTTVIEVQEWLDQPTPEPGPGEGTSEPTVSSLRELRPARLGERELRILFAMRTSDEAVLLYAEETYHDTATWYSKAIPSALERYRAYSSQ